ncbi:MAG: ABC transporter permease [Bacillaceae bacterium]|nr:ABC transporter permease [Bacillaceae bacterium]
MKIRTVGRHIRQGFLNLSRNGWMTFASVSAVSITLLILGVFLLLALNVNHLADVVENQVEIRAFLDLTADSEDIENVEKELEQILGVESYTFVSKDEGLSEFREGFPEQDQDLLEGLEEENPLPDSFVIKAVDPQKTGEVAEKVLKLPHVYDVTYGKETVEKLFKVTNTIRNFGLVFIIGLTFTALFLISNTIRLTIMARGKEIEIMKLVGATRGFIRGPFFVEGLLMGLIGSIIPIILLLVGYYFLFSYVTSEFLILNVMLPLYPLALQIAGILLGIGAFIGIWGSMMSVRKFLKI